MDKNISDSQINNIEEMLKNKIAQHKKQKADNNAKLTNRNKVEKNINYLHIYTYFHIFCFIISIWLYFRCNTDLNPINLLGALLFSPIYIIYMLLQPNFRERCNL
jgi:hypothetical protein